VADDFFDELDELTNAADNAGPPNPATDSETGLQKLASLVEDLNLDLSTSTILDRAMSAAIELTGAERGFLVLLSENGDWDFRVARNMDSGEIADASNAASHTVIRKVLERKRPILINDVVGGSDLTKHQSIAKMQVRSVMGAPLIAKGKLLGVAYVDTSKLAGVFDQVSLVMFETFVQLAAVALENARLIEASQEATLKYRDLQEYLRTVLDSQPHGIIILDSKLRIEYATPQASQILNGCLKEGALLTDARHGDATTQSLLADLQRFVETNATHRSVFSRGNRTFAYSFFPVHHAISGGRVGIILEDITGQKQLERKLIESEKQSTINQLAGGIAHEINNSLQPVKGRVELLQIRLKKAGIPVDNGIDKDLDTISALSERIEKIARDLRHLTKPATPDFEPLDLTRLARTTVELMETTTGTLRGFSSDPQSRFRLLLELEEGVPPILGDGHGLESALINLILNSCHAIRHQGSGMLKIKVATACEHVSLVVEDTGGGIAPEILPHIFEPYFTTRAESGGTGLGMCVLQNVADIHGAKLDLQSQWGVGTTIILTFPARKTADLGV
jgi:two-component system, NtrC family, sensor kinase